MRTPAELVAFHATQKMLLHVHDPALAKELGRLVARAGELEFSELSARYAELHARALATPSTPGRHQDVLEHLAGHLKDRLSRDERAELHRAIAGFRAGAVPLSKPVGLLRRHLREAGAEWAAAQAYLDA